MENKRRPKILILFAGTHLAYSPTVTQLYEALSKNADVRILAENAPGFIDEKVSGMDVVYFQEMSRPKIPAGTKIKYFFLRRFNGPARAIENAGFKLKLEHDHFMLAKNMVKKGRYDRIIAIDLKNMFFCTLLKVHVDFISLELGIGEQLLSFIDTRLIDAVITQSDIRYEYLFKNLPLRKFIVPNSPVFEEHPIPQHKQGLLYGGTAWDPFGFYHCLEYLREFPDTPLTLRGALPEKERRKIQEGYADLLQNKLLFIDETYLDNKDVVEYFSQFEIGICFYNFDVEWIRHFNYQSAPSGKLFKYLAAGVPVIAVDIIGFSFIKEMECGVLIPDLRPETIHAGIKEIRSRYAFYEANTLKAAAHFSFDRALQPYLGYVEGKK